MLAFILKSLFVSGFVELEVSLVFSSPGAAYILFIPTAIRTKTAENKVTTANIRFMIPPLPDFIKLLRNTKTYYSNIKILSI